MSTLVPLGLLGGVAALLSLFVRRDATLTRFALIGLSHLMSLRYLWWRFSEMPSFQLAPFELAVYLLLALELVATYLAVEDAHLLRRTKNRTPDVERQLDWYGDQAPMVDVFIATYNESWEVLEKTFVGATSVSYPNYRVWVLDDGNRSWLREKVTALGIGYITRTSNAHYKAGNLNNGLAELAKQGIEPEFIALLDADFIARPEFLRRTMALMQDPKIGIVQTPQCFYNPDPHQKAFGGIRAWPDEQRGWFDMYLPSLDALGWATCCGTSCLIRGEALRKVGGFPIESVCEDTLTSIKMSGQGFGTAYLHERLTIGLAPEGVQEFMSQRARWLLGGVQNTRFCGFTPGIWGRFKYWCNLYRFGVWGLLPLVWLFVLILYWFTGISLLPVANGAEAVSFIAPLWLIRLFEGWLFSGRMTVFVSDCVRMLLAPLWIRENIYSALGWKTAFKVTDKAQHREHGLIHWHLMSFHVVAGALLLAGFLYTMFDPAAPGHADGFFQATTIATIWSLLVIVAAVTPLFEGPRRRLGERYPTRELLTATFGAERQTLSCRDISLGGVRVQVAEATELPANLDLELAGVGVVHATFVRRPSKDSAVFAFHDDSARPSLIRKIYCSDDYIAYPGRWSLTRSIAGFVKRVLF